MNKEAPEDEMLLAELIAVASTHNLTSCKGAQFQDRYGNSVDSCDQNLPEGAVSCCALGAYKLAGFYNLPASFRLAGGNDARSASEMPDYFDDDTEISMWNIGAAFEMAMRDG